MPRSKLSLGRSTLSKDKHSRIEVQHRGCRHTKLCLAIVWPVGREGGPPSYCGKVRKLRAYFVSLGMQVEQATKGDLCGACGKKCLFVEKRKAKCLGDCRREFGVCERLSYCLRMRTCHTLEGEERRSYKNVDCDST